MLRNAKLATKLLAMVAFFIICFALYSYFAYRTIEQVRVNGPLYEEIVQGKDVIADVLPPPLYVIESYLMALQAVEESDPTRLAALIDRGGRLRVEFETRQQYWLRTLPSGQLKDLLTITSYRPAVEFFNLRDNAFNTALRAGDKKRARELLVDMNNRYEAHRQGVDQVVKVATEQNAAAEARADERIKRDSLLLTLSGLAVLVIVLLLAWYAAREAGRMSRRISLAAEVAARVAAGDLTAEVPETDADDETGRLLRAISTMTHNLRALVARAKQASVEILSSATEFAASSRQQEATVQGFTTSTNQIATAVRQISSTSNELQTAVEAINAVAAQTASLAEEGKSGLKSLDDTMDRLARVATTMSSRLGAIRQEAEEITGVVTTISKVADQTNLLSINAAIEAEKAGEQGLGFLVLAREIRRLADQTAVATLDIEEMVKQMQGAVSAGVMEIDRFAEEVRSGTTGVERIGGRFGQIISQVTSLSERFDSVNDGMRDQSSGARQISDAMGGLIEGARQTSASLREFNAATETLRDAIGGLKQQIAQFNVGN
jgi:methyl-accepting chemotaxis protein WspA